MNDVSEQVAGPEPDAGSEHVAGVVKFLVCVDDSEDCRTALRFACLRAGNCGGHIALLYVIEPADFQHWMAVRELMEEEQREEAEQRLQALAGEVYEYAGIRPVLHVRIGRKDEEILALIDEDPSINILVLGAAPEGKGSNELVRMLTTELNRSLRIPLTIVPGSLTDVQLKALT